MLPAGSRMSASTDFQSVMRRGAKSGRATVVVYLKQTGNAESIAGFAVSRAVGGAVIRNRVKRRLRAIMAEALPGLPVGSAVVIRALPRSADVDYVKLRGDVTEAIATAQRKAALA
ncbi:ribonuclease P protein component [Demequina litorisediminis]|uniref:Ribonuclease P protein component n=1 Tax=Demequina litorisediminis TaxID=1849022 RepID=A0ABQ6IDF0_9MICO|nr:ribonuclease P protein component [Demequina litorisediminis]GMA35750.1 ribonuclease P protein component [Demequina litorisediminis]